MFRNLYPCKRIKKVSSATHLPPSSPSVALTRHDIELLSAHGVQEGRATEFFHTALMTEDYDLSLAFEKLLEGKLARSSV